MNLIKVHRIPEPKNSNVLIDPRFELIVDGKSHGEYRISSAASDFLESGRLDELVVIEKDGEIRIETFTENPEQLAVVEVFVEFESIAKKTQAPFNFVFEDLSKGKYTLNVEFTSKAGIKNAARAYISME